MARKGNVASRSYTLNMLKTPVRDSLGFSSLHCIRFSVIAFVLSVFLMFSRRIAEF